MSSPEVGDGAFTRERFEENGGAFAGNVIRLQKGLASWMNWAWTRTDRQSSRHGTVWLPNLCPFAKKTQQSTRQQPINRN